MTTIKLELKAQAKEIREMKSIISKGMRNGLYKGQDQYAITLLQEAFRYKHVAYCMLRGREYLEIENKTRPRNEINKQKLERIALSMELEILKRKPTTPIEGSQDA